MNIENETLSQPIKLGWFPTDMAVNPTTNKIYGTNFNSNTTSVIDGNTNQRINITSNDFLFYNLR
jgi:YVTN family beta-propeller protein